MFGSVCGTREQEKNLLNAGKVKSGFAGPPCSFGARRSCTACPTELGTCGQSPPRALVAPPRAGAVKGRGPTRSHQFVCSGVNHKRAAMHEQAHSSRSFECSAMNADGKAGTRTRLRQRTS